MKASETARTPITHHAVYRDFKHLDRERRRHIALRILRDEKMSADLYDHFLIQHSLHEPGQDLAWGSYVRQNGSGN